MGNNLKIWILLGIAVTLMVAAIWQFANLRGLKLRGRRRAPPPPDPRLSQRRSDSRNLSGAEKKLYVESQRLLQAGKVAAASRILEQLGMQREAIQALEDHGLIHDAAKVLTRLQRHNRAGVVYARHGMWLDAARCFKVANMPLEVAKCAREAGDLGMAAEYFEIAGRAEDAAECWEQLGSFHKAARIFITSGQLEKGMDLYNRLAATSENLGAVEFQEEELANVMTYVGAGHTDKGLADIIVSHNKLTPVILTLVSKGLSRQAAEVYTRARSDAGPLLMAEVNYQDRSAKSLAEMFVAVSNFQYAGMIFERMGTFDRAADAFERSEDFERASYCYERAGIDAKAKLLKEKARHAPRRGERHGNANFALSAITGNDQAAGHSGFSPSADDSTAVIDVEGGGAPVSPSRPPARSDTVDNEPETAAERPPPPPASSYPPASRGGRAAGNFRLTDADSAENHSVRRDNGRRQDGAQPAASTDDDRDPADDAQDHSPQDLDGDGDAGNAGPGGQILQHPGRGTAAVPPAGGGSIEAGRAAFDRAKFFADLDDEQRGKIWQIGVTHAFSPDETVLTYNDEPAGVYVIIDGAVSCFKQMNGKEAYVDQMKDGESFGELWLLADQPTAVRFVAMKETRIRVIARDDFNALLDKDGTIARKLYKRFTMRLLRRLLKQQNNSKNQIAS